MKEEKEEQKKKFHLKKDQLLIGLLTGILLIVAAWPVKSTGKKAGENLRRNEEVLQETVENPGSLTLDYYTRQLEQRLAEALSKVEGVGKVYVMINWKSSAEKVVEKDRPGNERSTEETEGSGSVRTTVEKSVQESTVYEEGEDGARSPYIVKEIQPVPEGVLIVAQGGGNSVVAGQILGAVQALFPLDAHKIKIMKMEGPM